MWWRQITLAITAVFGIGLVGSAPAGQPWTFKSPELVRFEPGRRLIRDGYVATFYRVRLEDGREIYYGELNYNYYDLPCGGREYRLGLTVNHVFLNRAFVAMLGGLYRIGCDDRGAGGVLVADKDLPAGIKPLQIDSFTLQYDRDAYAKLGTLTLRLTELKPAANKGEKHSATIEIGAYEIPTRRATIKEGDIVLLDGKRGFLVRGIVPPIPEHKIAGWVEFAPQPIPEADLIRDKKAYIRPMPKAEKK